MWQFYIGGSLEAGGSVLAVHSPTQLLSQSLPVWGTHKSSICFPGFGLTHLNNYFAEACVDPKALSHCGIKYIGTPLLRQRRELSSTPVIDRCVGVFGFQPFDGRCPSRPCLCSPWVRTVLGVAPVAAAPHSCTTGCIQSVRPLEFITLLTAISLTSDRCG